MGTVLSIDASEGAKGTFVEVAIKPEWFSARTVEVFINEVELVGAVIEELAVVQKPALIKVPAKRKHYSLGEMQVFEAFKENFLKENPGAETGKR